MNMRLAFNHTLSKILSRVAYMEMNMKVNVDKRERAKFPSCMLPLSGLLLLPYSSEDDSGEADDSPKNKSPANTGRKNTYLAM